MFYFFQMDPASPYFPKASQLICSRGAANCGGLAPDLTDPIDAIWTDPDNSRFGGTLNTAQRVLLTFSGSNAGWDYSADLNYSKNHNNNRWTGGIPNETVLAPGGVLSDLINPFGSQSAAGQALTVGSYSLWDAYGVYKPTPKLAVLFGIKNLFDTSPPFTNAQQLNFAAGYNALVADPLL
jgi:hypothetical protein